MLSRRCGLIVLMMIAGCGKKPVEPDSNLTLIDSDDPKMNAAIEKARATVSTFTAALKSPKPGQSAFAIKMMFDDGSEKEHMWLSEVRFDGKKFHGVINNDPKMVKNVHIGDKRSIDASQISDWMYIQNRKLVGGYTLRALRDSMPAAERAEFDKGMPFVID